MSHTQIIALTALAHRFAHARWHSIACFFGDRSLRDSRTMQPMLPRDPHAPGFGPVHGEESFCSTMCTVMLGSLDESEREIDQALYRLECQVREQFRGSSAKHIPPVIAWQDGDRIHPVPLVGSTCPIRFRINQCGEALRIDFELLLRRVAGEQCVIETAACAIGAIRHLIDAAHLINPSVRLMLDQCGTGDDRVTVAIGIGSRAADVIGAAAEQLADELRDSS